MAELVTIPNIKILETGTFALSTGNQTFTEDDLASAVAALADPCIKCPRLKVGHTDGRLDGEPAFGRFENLRLGDNGQAIYADMVGVPRWLADIMPTAYPNRSIEGVFGFKPRADGKAHQFVITAVALLGVQMPGISSLADLEKYYEDPEIVQIAASVAVYGENMPKPKKVAAATDVSDVSKAFYNDFAQGERQWWWIRAIRIDPQEVIVDDEDTGDLYRVPYDIGASGVTFGEPVQVEIQYKDVKQGQKTAASSMLAVFASAAESRPEERNQMTPKDIRLSLGLAETATDEEVKAKIEALKAEAEKAEPESPAPDSEPSGGDDDEPGTDGQTSTRPAPAPPEGVLVEASAFEALKKDAAMGRQAREEQIKGERDNFIAAAVKRGKFAPVQASHFRKLLDADPTGTKTLIESFQDGVVPIGELGVAASGEGQVEKDAGYDETWLSPQERARIKAAREGDLDPITMEG